MTEENGGMVEYALISKFECPVCFKYMIPPIRLCLSGHTYCEFCFKKLLKCALCRANKSPYRCVVLEQIHAALLFPCRYIESGCAVVTKGDTISAHQEYCEYARVSCPLRFNDCEWRGLRDSIISHCNDIHPGNTFFLSEQTLKVSKFSDLIDRHYYILINVFDHIFRCTWDVNRDTGLTRFAVYSLSKPNNEKFYFKIAILSGDTSKEVVTLTGPCYHMKDDSKRFIEDKYLSINHNMLKEFCDSNGTFNYVISIFDKI